MIVVVQRPADLSGLFVRAQPGAGRPTRYIAAAAFEPGSTTRVILRNDAEPIGSVGIGESITLATKSESLDFVASELSQADADGIRTAAIRAAAFPAAIVFCATFLIILFAAGHTGHSFITDLNVLSQFGTPALCSLVAGAGIVFLDVRARSQSAEARTATESMWADRCAAHTTRLKAGS